MKDSKAPGTSYRFVPVVRQGFRPQKTEFALDRSADDSKINGPLSFPVELTVAATPKDDAGKSKTEVAVSKDVQLYGPGDVEGIDHDQVVRVEPEPNTADFPPNYFPLIEFNHPGFPWLFSPEYTKDDSNLSARNRPWIALVVVDKAEASVTAEGPGNLPVLEAAPSELPPPSETWAWAHSQVVGEEGSLASVIGNNGSRTVSRLLCPRNLHRKGGEDGGTEYIAAVVPTFEPGRLAGLGREPYPDSDDTNDGNAGGSQSIEFAWSTEGSDARKLPVYYMWEFQVGSQDFESLVSELEPRQLSTSDVGVRDVDVSNPGPDQLIPTNPDEQTIDQVGALKAPSIDPDTYQKRQTLVEQCLNKPAKLTTSSSGSGATTDKPVVGASLYGQWYVDAERVTDSHKWFRQLNENPAFRLGAGFGAEVVREHQEEYMEAAWEQVGELDELNRLLRGGQLSRAASNRIHLALGDDVEREDSQHLGRLLQFTRPLQGRLPDRQPGTEDVGRTLKRKLEEAGDFPEPVLSPAYRRLTSPRGALARNANLSLQQPNVSPTDPVPPTAFADEFVEGRTTPADLAEELDPRIVTLDDMAPTPFGGVTPFVPLSGDLEDADPPALLTTRASSAFGFSVVDPSTPPSTITAPDTGGVDSTIPSRDDPPVERDGIEGLPDELLRVHRLGNWAHSLPAMDLEPADIRTATPADDAAFVVRKIDTQLERAIEQTSRAIQELRSLRPADGESGTTSAAAEGSTADGERSPGADLALESVVAVDEQLRAVGTTTFEPLNRTLDNLLSTRPGAVPAAIENDKSRLVSDLVEHHETAKASLAALRAYLGDETIDDGDLEPTGIDGKLPFDLGEFGLGDAGPIDPGGVDAGDHPGVDPNTGPPDVGPENDYIDKTTAHMVELLERIERLRGSLNYGDEVLQSPDDLEDDVEDVGDGPSIQDPRSIMDLLDPDVTIPEKVLARADGSGSDLRSRADPLEEVLWAPSFDRPMFDPLRKLSEQYLLPGAEDINRKTIGAVSTNPAFVESYLVGLNHEFARELLWRRFPTDRTGTYFRKFWNDVQNPTSDPGPDIQEIHKWTNPDLGGSIGSPNVVLILRGELLRQFPNTTIYMAKAEWTDEGLRTADVSAANDVTKETVEAASGDDSTDLEDRVKFPIFRGALDPDITFLGFDLAPADAMGGELPEDKSKLETMAPSDRPDPGWFFVFEEPMGETRFGFDAGDDSDDDAPMGIHKPADNETVSVDTGKVGEGGEVAWNGLSWHHVAPGDPSETKYVHVWESMPGGEQDLSNAAPDEGNTWRVTNTELTDIIKKIGDLKPDLESSKASWGRNSAHMARITFQRPVRVTVHADDVLRREAESDAWEDAETTNGGGG